MDGKSKNLTKEYIEQIKVLFPEVVTEIADKDGNDISYKVDMEKLAILLGEAAIPVDETEYRQKYGEKFSFEWAGKRWAIAEAQKRSTGTLRPCPEESVNWEDTENLYIEGDNLEVLKLLQDSYLGAVKMIYIDPPYNTGKDFVYKDDYRDNLSNYMEMTNTTNAVNSEASGRYHTNWLNMMYPRLKLARNLLTDDGVIFISIDDNEVSNLKSICDEIFGEDNFAGTIALQTATDNNPGQIKIEHEYMHCYCKNKQQQNHWFGDLEKTKLIQDKYIQLKNIYISDYGKIQEELRKWIKVNEKNLKGITHYDNVDEQGVFHDGDIANTTFGGYEYDIVHPQTGRICKMPEKGYRFPEETMAQMLLENNILFGKDETTLPKPKKRLEDAKDMLRSMIYEDGRASTKRFETLMARDIFQNPKSETIISRLVNFICKPNDLILDFFSGSGTTAEAVLLSASKKIGLKYILVQLPENLDISLLSADNKAKKTIKNSISFLDTINKPHVISEIAKERIRRVGKKILEEQKAKNGGLFAEESPKLDIGFKVFKLDHSNVKDWDVEFDGLDEKQAEQQLRAEFNKVMNILKENRTELDLLYEVMLKLGLQLSTSVETKQVEGKNVFVVGHGVMIASFSKGLTYAQIGKMLDQKAEFIQASEFKVVLSDESFASNNDKTNAMQLFKQRGITNYEII